MRYRYRYRYRDFDCDRDHDHEHDRVQGYGHHLAHVSVQCFAVVTTDPAHPAWKHDHRDRIRGCLVEFLGGDS